MKNSTIVPEQHIPWDSKRVNRCVHGRRVGAPCPFCPGGAYEPDEGATRAWNERKVGPGEAQVKRIIVGVNGDIKTVATEAEVDDMFGDEKDNCFAQMAKAMLRNPEAAPRLVMSPMAKSEPPTHDGQCDCALCVVGAPSQPPPQRERCVDCDKPIATDTDYAATAAGEGDALCWKDWHHSCQNEKVDWRARALKAEAEPERAQQEAPRSTSPTFARDRMGKLVVQKSGVLRVEVACCSGDTKNVVLETAANAVRRRMSDAAKRGDGEETKR